ncbi:MAG: 23S rRNA (adenine(2503)-C(2))-methyltransferase RlmN, partial [Planctomycetes bacterium]|nr:23S rRNA (adenine(2503)-C(2))-methyltransferase RlmN [Planctomycetota bacterium]
AVGAVGAGERTEVLGLLAGELDRDLGGLLAQAGEPPYRLRQLREWIHRRTPESFAAMSDLPKALRDRLAEAFTLHPLERRLEDVSKDGTRKVLWSRLGGGTIESVLIPERERTTYCISTQSGCPVRCTFCATGHGGFEGQLRAAEIVDQVLLMRSLTGCPPTNVVYMGMGEPLLNFEATCRSLEVLTHPDLVGFGARRITVSTVGIPERIRELGRRFPQVKLALSLHAPRDDLRDEIIPLNRKHPLGEVLAAVRDHAEATGKRATFEYILLPGVNDSEPDAREVRRRLKGIPSRINLIGFNPFPGAPYSKPSVERLLRFRAWLEEGYAGDVTIRRSRGEDIDGACGQLSLRHAAAAGPVAAGRKPAAAGAEPAATAAEPAAEPRGPARQQKNPGLGDKPGEGGKKREKPVKVARPWGGGGRV